MPTTITAYKTFSPNTPARSSEVNTNFNNHRGDLLPINTDTATASDNTHDLGSQTHRFRNGYFAGSLYCMGRIYFDTAGANYLNWDTATSAYQFNFSSSTGINIQREQTTFDSTHTCLEFGKNDNNYATSTASRALEINIKHTLSSITLQYDLMRFAVNSTTFFGFRHSPAGGSLTYFGDTGVSHAYPSVDNFNFRSREGNECNFRLQSPTLACSLRFLSNGKNPYFELDGLNEKFNLNLNSITCFGIGSGSQATTTAIVRISGYNASSTVADLWVVNTDANATSTHSVVKLEFSSEGSTGTAKWISFFNSGGEQGNIAGSNTGGVSYNTTSDASLKYDIVDFSFSSEVFERILPRKFKWKKTGTPSIGFIAQELESAVPTAVTKNTEFKMIDYGKITPVLASAIKNMLRRIDALEKSVEALTK